MLNRGVICKMKSIYLKARAKVNLNLKVKEKRKDNYHNIESVFQKINLYDELYIQKIETNHLEIQTNIQQLKQEENIISKAYNRLKEKYDSISGVQVNLKKNIPMQAGLAGGSTDCASFLIGMNQLFDLKMTKKEIEEIGKSLGADVVPCFYNQAIKVEGIGDKIEPIHTHFKYYLVIIKPQFSCNTKQMYQKIDEQKKIKQLKNTNKIIQGLEQNNLVLIGEHLYNVFEEVIEERQKINEIKESLLKRGAIGSLMTGTGSCVYGIFANKKIAKIAYNQLKDIYQTYLCVSYNSQREARL